MNYERMKRYEEAMLDHLDRSKTIIFSKDPSKDDYVANIENKDEHGIFAHLNPEERSLFIKDNDKHDITLRDDEDHFILKFTRLGDNISIGVNDIEVCEFLFGVEYAMFTRTESGKASIVIKQFPDILVNGVPFGGITDAFPFVQQRTNYTRTDSGKLYLTTSIQLYLSPDTVELYDTEIITTPINSARDIDFHNNKVNYRVALYRSINTLDLAPNAKIVETIDGKSEILIIDYFESVKGFLRIVGNIVHAASEELAKGAISFPDFADQYRNYTIIDPEIPVFKIDNNITSVLISPYDESDVSANENLNAIAGFIQEIVDADEDFEALDIDKINELVNRFRSGGKVYPSRNKVLISFKSVYEKYKRLVIDASNYFHYLADEVNRDIYLYRVDEQILDKMNIDVFYRQYHQMRDIAFLFGFDADTTVNEY